MTRHVLSLAALALACAAEPRPVTEFPPAPPARNVIQSVFLIGDGGKPRQGFEPVLVALGGEIRRSGAPSTTVFLGDNVYPSGIPEQSSAARPEMERRLRDQVEAVVDADGEAIVIPGNHDWAKGGRAGRAAVLRAQVFVEAAGRGRARQLPAGACPGPAVADAGPLRLVLLDTQWWLHEHDKPDAVEDGCGVTTRTAIVDSIGAVLAASGDRHVLVLGHHPLATGGKHGGHFGWKEHLFPLTEAASWAWLPLPILGSLYPLARKAGTSEQDLSNGRYRRMRDSLLAAFTVAPPLVYAAGHEHNLQLFRGNVVPNLIVSGTGYYGHGSLVHWTDSTRYASTSAGFVRIDATDRGGVRLSFLVVDEQGTARETFATWLVTAP